MFKKRQENYACNKILVALTSEHVVCSSRQRKNIKEIRTKINNIIKQLQEHFKIFRVANVCSRLSGANSDDDDAKLNPCCVLIVVVVVLLELATSIKETRLRAKPNM